MAPSAEGFKQRAGGWRSVIWTLQQPDCLAIIGVSSWVVREESKEEQRDKEGNNGINEDLEGQHNGMSQW